MIARLQVNTALAKGDGEEIKSKPESPQLHTEEAVSSKRNSFFFMENSGKINHAAHFILG
ncbi:hypothetical protein [Paenibacillus luteus]|uniref:hypothetical protein n=1 Tax=Paenibacillus luteus TaxID=2545753 RepID=UPI0011412820|nr:hypothetical protein [Paenibacillus luteus]